MFLIEQRLGNGTWIVRGSEPYERDARYHAKRYAQLHDAVIRVREKPQTRKLRDPTPIALSRPLSSKR